MPTLHHFFANDLNTDRSDWSPLERLIAPRESIFGRTALKTLHLLFLAFLTNISTKADANEADIYYHSCTQLPSYPDCTGYTGQDFGSMYLHIEISSSFPDGDFDVEYNHPQGGTAGSYIS